MTYVLALLARVFGPLLVKLAPALLPYVGWIKPALRFIKYAAVIGVVAYATAWFVKPRQDLHAQCQAAVNAASRVALQVNAQAEAKAAAAAANARAAMMTDLEAAQKRAADLEVELAKYHDDPVVFPKSLVKELRR